MRSDDRRTIRPSQLNRAAQSGTVFEMSIVLTQAQNSETNRSRCPRCRHVNTIVVPHECGKWIEWQVSFFSCRKPYLHDVRFDSRKCSENFQVEKATDSDEEFAIEFENQIVDAFYTPPSHLIGRFNNFTLTSKSEEVDEALSFRRLQVFASNLLKETVRVDILWRK